MLSTLSVIETVWISESAIGEDFIATFRPLDGLVRDEMTVFAIHSMGWIQVEDISGLVNVTFDARSIQDETVKNLVEYLLANEDKQAARIFRFSIFTGKSWFRQTATDLIQFVETLLQVTEFGEVPAAPTAIRTESITLAGLSGIADPAVRGLFDLWRSGSRSRSALEGFVNNRLTDRSVKVLVRDGPSYVFDSYSMDPRATWDHRTRERFWRRRVEDAVPDRGLARNVSVAADAALASGGPRLEKCAGPIRSAQRQIGLFDWFRLTLPMEPANRRGGSPEVLMAVWK